MDPFTQTAFGAVVGQAGFAPKLGRRALIAGAAIAAAPDLDVFYITSDPLGGWIYHRGITHSLIAGPFFGAILGWLAWHFYRWWDKRKGIPPPENPKETRPIWIALGVLAFTTHAFLDLMTPYGTQLLAPLSNARFALNALPVVDIIYTLILAIALVAGWRLIKTRARTAAAFVGGAALLLTVVWQFYGLALNKDAQAAALADAKRQGFGFTQADAFPILFQPWLRRVSLESADAYHMTYWSPFNPAPLDWRSYPKVGHPFAARFEQTREYRVLDWFASGQIFLRVVPQPADGGVRLEAHDIRYMRFGEIMEGFWGIDVLYAEDGETLQAPAPFRRRPSISETEEILGITFGGN